MKKTTQVLKVVCCAMATGIFVYNMPVNPMVGFYWLAVATYWIFNWIGG